jgi:hypothetical protein
VTPFSERVEQTLSLNQRLIPKVVSIQHQQMKGEVHDKAVLPVL